MLYWIAISMTAATVTAHAAVDPIPALARTVEWQRLLHFQRHWYGAPRSEVEGPDFFLSPGGRQDAEAELRADLEAFADPERRVGKLSQRPQCAFPVRYEFLKRALGLSPPPVDCPEYADYLKRFRAHSATLVFSSAYPGSPASMFGHTFLRINAKVAEGEVKIDLLDFGLNYQAMVPPNENSFLYAYLGLSGGYRGQFGMAPYYNKVREYNNGESRDLWEYDLSLSEAETLRLVGHAWEIETNGWMDYYFATENCAYQLMALLEAVRPDWDLTPHFAHVIPAETVKALVAIPGAVTRVRFRPSLFKRMLARVDALTANERRAFDDLRKHRRAPDEADDAATLDALAALVEYRKESDGGKLSEEDRGLLRQALARRSRLPSADGEPPVAEDSRPEAGHFPYRLGVSGGVFTDSAATLAFTELAFRFAYHDLMNDDRGYLPFSRVDFPGVTLRYRPADRRLGVEQMMLASLTSLSALGMIERRVSWHVQADYYSAHDFGCLDCHVLRGEGAVGTAVNLFSPRAVLYGLVYGYAEAGEGLAQGIRGGPKFELAAIVNPVAAYKTRLSAMVAGDLFQSLRPEVYYRGEWEHSMSFGRDWELRASWVGYAHGITAARYEEAKVTINRYF